MCGLDSMVITLLLFSILTTELAEEIQRNLDGRYHKWGFGRVWVSCISKTLPQNSKFFKIIIRFLYIFKKNLIFFCFQYFFAHFFISVKKMATFLSSVNPHPDPTLSFEI